MALVRVKIFGFYICDCGRANGMARWSTICGECMQPTKLVPAIGRWPGRFMVSLHGTANPRLEWFVTTEWFPGRSWDPAWHRAPSSTNTPDSRPR